MAKGTPFNLDGFVKNPDGSYSKKSNPQPRENIIKMKFPQPTLMDKAIEIQKGIDGARDTIDKQLAIYNQTGHIVYNHVPSKFREIKLTLFGIPMPKQSVRSANGHFWQPQKTVDRKKDYIRQIKEQLPSDFVKFTTEVHLLKFHCIFPPLKGFHKIKGRMEAIRNGEIFYKNTKPDLIDNLKKLCFDSMEDIISNDSIIVTENDTAKRYGIGGCIIIEMKGY